MRRVVAFLLAGAVLASPINAQAHGRQSPKPIEVTYSEAQELMQLAWCEGGNQGEWGMLLIMSTVINRVNSSDYPDTIHEVIYQEHQYATKGMKEATLCPEAHYALAMLEAGTVYPDIIAFEVKEDDSLQQYFDVDFTYLNHTFYTKKGKK